MKTKQTSKKATWYFVIFVEIILVIFRAVIVTFFGSEITFCYGISTNFTVSMWFCPKYKVYLSWLVKYDDYHKFSNINYLYILERIAVFALKYIDTIEVSSLILI